MIKSINEAVASPNLNNGLRQPVLLSNESVNILTNRIGDEYTAHYFYNAAANWCAGAGYKKAAVFFAKESANELEHALKLQKYLVDWNVMPVVPGSETHADFGNLPEIIERSYNLEYDLFQNYNKDSQYLFPIDLTTFDFLQEFRQGQTASVIEYADLLNALQLIDIDKRLDLLHFEELYLG